MANSNFTNLFNMGNSVVEAPQAIRNAEEYKVSFKEGKGGIYESVIRFVPWYQDPEKNIISKTTNYVKNPLTGQGMYLDDPKTVGQPSPVIDMFFKFYNSGNAAFQDFGKKHLSSKPVYAALVQIIKDDQHPDLVGKIKVFKFGKKLWDKLYAEEHPAMGQGINPFHPIYGRYFYLKCTSQSGFNNFDQSYFFDNKNAQNQVLPMGIWYVNAAGNYEPVTESTDQQAVYNFLQSNSPDLNKYGYQPWTTEQAKFVEDVLRISAEYLQTGTIQQNLQAVNTATPAAPAGLNMTTNPVFPGATTQPAPAAPTTLPQMPAGIQAAPAPAAPVPNMGAVNMGGLTPGGSMPVPSAPSISGVDIPTVEPATAPSNGIVPNLGGVIGNVDDVLANL